jgi:hypothetical protein
MLSSEARQGTVLSGRGGKSSLVIPQMTQWPMCLFLLQPWVPSLDEGLAP